MNKHEAKKQLENIRQKCADIKKERDQEQTQYSILAGNWREALRQACAGSAQADKAHKLREAREKLDKLVDELKDAEMLQEYALNNYKCAEIAELAPVIVKVLARYNGKQYGEKTKQKIADELQSLCGWRCYLNSYINIVEIGVNGYSNGNTYKIYSSNIYHIIDAENRINAPTTAEELRAWDVGEFVADIFAQKNNAKKLRVKIKNQVATLNELIDEYNKIAPHNEYIDKARALYY